MLRCMIIFSVVYLVSTINIYTGSSSVLFRSAYEEEDCKWICEKYSLVAEKIPNQKYVFLITDFNTGQRYVLGKFGDFCVVLYDYKENMDLKKYWEYEELASFYPVYRKKWWKIEKNGGKYVNSP